jgi:predicted transcriptional regulator
VVDGLPMRRHVGSRFGPVCTAKQSTSDEYPMSEMTDQIFAATTRIVSAWTAAHAVAPNALAGLIRDVHQALASLEPPRSGGQPEKPELAQSRWVVLAAVDVRKSVFADHLVCLEDGKTFKTLTRHLGETHGMTPEQYRAKWDLPESYPMIAPEYAQRRSALSKQIGLGRRVEPPTPVNRGRDLTE